VPCECASPGIPEYASAKIWGVWCVPLAQLRRELEHLLTRITEGDAAIKKTADDGLPSVSAWKYPLRSLPRVSLSASSERSKTCPALPCFN
jgi:hypothetical protein